ncbi:MAG TPA: glycosyltransferase family 1 protein [Candidatus Angelobacter sp.]|nr:glycosyltransferase family 1 protein [Candidatus Angelobacter sp.]
MKIAFDLRRIGNPGIGRYMKCLVESVVKAAPENNYLLVLPPGREEAVAVDGPNVARVTPDLKYYSIREQVVLPRLLRQHEVDLLHSPHFLLPVMCPCPAVVTIHDVIYLACKEDLPSLPGRLYYRAMMSLAVRSAERIITDSEFSRNDIVARLNGDSEKIDVIYPGVDARFARVQDEKELHRIRAKYGITGDYILYAGIYKLRKNHAGLLRAFKKFLVDGIRAQCVIAGPLQEGENILRRMAAELGISESVVFAGFVPETDLPALYSAAKIYACPSLYEGFGFTVLEAMACGTPVVCSPATSLPEAAGNGALYADSKNTEDFAHALRRAFHDETLRRELIEKGYKNAKSFTWDRASEQTLAIYQRVVGAPLRNMVRA